MTNLTYDADFRLYVRPETWESDGPDSAFFTGIYTVSLNSLVRIAFVPDVSEVCPPWSEDVLPNGSEYQTCRRYMTGDANGAIGGAYDAGAEAYITFSPGLAMTSRMVVTEGSWRP